MAIPEYDDLVDGRFEEHISELLADSLQNQMDELEGELFR
jgi:peptide deformylase